MTAPPAPQRSTPEPVLKAAYVWGTIAAFIVSAIGVLTTTGVLSSAEADAINYGVGVVSDNIVPLGIMLVGVTGLVSGIVSHLVTAFASRRKVVPIDSDAFDIVPKTVVPAPSLLRERGEQ